MNTAELVERRRRERKIREIMRALETDDPKVWDMVRHWVSHGFRTAFILERVRKDLEPVPPGKRRPATSY